MHYIKEAKKEKRNKDDSMISDVAEIIESVKRRGDGALAEYCLKFDGSKRDSFLVGEPEIDLAMAWVDRDLLSHMKTAARNIRDFALRQRETILDLPETEMSPGLFLGHRNIPVGSCACYVPGGGYPLFSTALMLAIPASVAGVTRIAACSPTMKGTDRIHPAIIAALHLAGANQIYALGGAQAIAAFAWGTEQIAPVDIIVGPGNRYVTEAKRQCYGKVGIDFVAGPSEVLIIADENADPEVLATDLLAQSEHDVDARGILISTDRGLAEETLKAVESQLTSLETAIIARKAWDDNGEILLAESLREAWTMSNAYAPEHLELAISDPGRVIPHLSNYGALFVGELSAEVFGDYVSGTNHTLPTLGASRYTGGVWVGTFMKTCTSQRMTADGLFRLAPIAEAMAKAEGLQGHARAASIRLEKQKKFEPRSMADNSH